MLKTYTIPLSNISINSLYDLWINNGFDDESNVDIHKDLLLGSEKTSIILNFMFLRIKTL